MRISAWVFHLDDNAFKMGCKDFPDYLDDHIIIGSSHMVAVAVSVCVCVILLQLGYATLNVRS